MDLYEYQARELLEEQGIPTPKAIFAQNSHEVAEAADQIGYPNVIKAQVKIGHRGQAGGVKLAKTRDESILASEDILPMTIHKHKVSGVLVAFFAGRALGMIIRFAVGTRSTGIWGEELVNALQDIGLDVATLTRNQELHARVRSLNASLDDDLVEGSRIYDMRTTSGKRYVVSVLDAQTHTAGYLKQLWDWLRFTGIATRRDRNVCDTVQHHFAMLLALSAQALTSDGAFSMVLPPKS